MYSAWAHTSPTWFTRIRAAGLALFGALSSVSSAGTDRAGASARGVAKRVRRAPSAAPRKRSMASFIGPV